VPDAEGLRPTPDRVRETVFNWLGHLLDANWAPVSCLDFFAGSGALGFEAASRGARSVTMIENFGPAIRLLEATKQKLQADSVNIIRGDALAIAQDMATRKASMGSMAAVDLIFSIRRIIMTGCQECSHCVRNCWHRTDWSMSKPSSPCPVKICRTG